MQSTDNSDRSWKILEAVSDLRVVVGRIEATMAERGHIIADHRSRMDTTDARVDTIDRKVTEIGHHLKTNIQTVGDNRERIKGLEGRTAFSKRLEMLWPALILIGALLFKIPPAELLHMIK